jgi:hypothetical protein
MGETDFSLIILFSDVENDLRVFPFAFVLREIKVVVQDMPDHSFAGNKLNDLQSAEVDVLVMIGPFAAQLVRAAFYVLGPPSADIVDGIESLLWCLIYQNGSGEIFIFHRSKF